MTAGIREILVRLENIAVQLPDDQVKAIEKIQRVRNRIEHHRYDHNEKEDDLILGEAFKVVLFFVEFVLEKKLGEAVGAELISEMQARVFDYNERESLHIIAFMNGCKSNGRNGTRWSATVTSLRARMTVRCADNPIW